MRTSAAILALLILFTVQSASAAKLSHLEKTTNLESVVKTWNKIEKYLSDRDLIDSMGTSSGLHFMRVKFAPKRAERQFGSKVKKMVKQIWVSYTQETEYIDMVHPEKLRRSKVGEALSEVAAKAVVTVEEDMRFIPKKFRNQLEKIERKLTKNFQVYKLDQGDSNGQFWGVVLLDYANNEALILASDEHI